MKAAKIALVLLTLTLTIACNNTGSRITTGTQPTVATSPAPSASVATTARANFEKHCTTCHGDRGEAGIVKVNNKTLRVPSLRTGHALAHTDDKLAKQISEGDDEMPAFKDKLTTDQINELIRYIRKDFQGK